MSYREYGSHQSMILRGVNCLVRYKAKANYTIDAEKAEVFSKVFIIPDSDIIAEKQVVMVIHNGTFYVFEFGGHFNTFNKSGEKGIGQHIIESINWTEPSPWRKYNNSTLGVSLEYPFSWDLNSTTNEMCSNTGTCFAIVLLNESINADKTFMETVASAKF